LEKEMSEAIYKTGVHSKNACQCLPDASNDVAYLLGQACGEVILLFTASGAKRLSEARIT